MRVLRYALVALLAVAGVGHFARAEAFASIVPPVLGPPEPYVYASGVAELTVALLLAITRTSRIGGYAAIALFVAVFPANVYAALQGGYDFDPPLDSPWIAWGRLPLQLILIAWAWKIARGSR